MIITVHLREKGWKRKRRRRKRRKREEIVRFYPEESVCCYTHMVSSGEPLTTGGDTWCGRWLGGGWDQDSSTACLGPVPQVSNGDCEVRRIREREEGRKGG